ncbi:MAG: hypothetical protein LAP40_16975 [Acidobacteriia bacterium]|nr:hypothetical protein [Terriglobia bacterium]
MSRLENLELPSSVGFPSGQLEALNSRFLLIAERLKSSSSSTGGLLQASHKERIGQSQYAAENQTAGTQFWESDRASVYLVRTVKNAKVWQFEAGLYADAFANRPSDLSLYDSGFLFEATDRGVLYRWDGGAWRYLAGTIYDTHAHRSGYAAADYPRATYVESDTGLTYVSTSALWVYTAGMYTLVEASLAAYAATLGLTDIGTLVFVSDYLHVLKWGGLAWQWGPGETGSHPIVGHPFDPGSGWQLCDGTTVAYLNANGTTTNFTTPNLSGQYLKFNNAGYTGTAASGGTTADTTATNNAASTGVTVDGNTTGITLPANTGNDSGGGTAVQSGAGTTVATHTHTHTEGSITDPGHAHTVTDPTHNHTQNAHHHAPGTIDLARTELLPYFRR